MANYRALPASLIERIAKENLKVLRNKAGVALNVSYTEDGLKWTGNKDGRALYYKNARISGGKITGKDLTKSNQVIVETFVPTNFDPYRRDKNGEVIVDQETGKPLLDSVNVFKQSAEATWVGKAIRLINFN